MTRTAAARIEELEAELHEAEDSSELYDVGLRLLDLCRELVVDWDLWASSVIAFKDHTVRHIPFIVKATNEHEAKGKAVRVAERLFLEDGAPVHAAVAPVRRADIVDDPENAYMKPRTPNV